MSGRNESHGFNRVGNLMMPSIGARARVGLLVATLLAAGAGGVATSWAQGNTAIVTGSQRVFVRRGPGTEFPAFGSLAKGETVEVQEMKGEWARVMTPGGQTGYMNSIFLALPGEHVTLGAAPRPTAAPRIVTQTEPDLTALGERNKALEAQLRSLQDELTALKNRPEPTPAMAQAAAPAAAGSESMRTELTRLNTAIEGLERRLDLHATSDPGAPASNGPIDVTPHVVSPTAILLGACGLVLGWLLGTAHGRNQERGRRSRIRF